MKKINVKQVETIQIAFEDGVTKNCKFSAYTMGILEEEFGGFEKVFRGAQLKPFSNGAKLLYAGMKSCDEEVTLDEAKQITKNMDVDAIIELFMYAKDSIEVAEEKKQKAPVAKKSTVKKK